MEGGRLIGGRLIEVGLYKVFQFKTRCNFWRGLKTFCKWGSEPPKVFISLILPKVPFISIQVLQAKCKGVFEPPSVE